MTDDEMRGWVERYADAWRSRAPGAMAAMWHPTGRLRHPLLDREIDGTLVPVNNDRTKALVPDLTWQLQSWAWRDDAVFLHFRWTGTVSGTVVDVEGVDRMHVHDGRIRDELVCIDTLPFRRALDPELSDAALVTADRLPAPVPRETTGAGRQDRLTDDELNRWIQAYVESWSSREVGAKAPLWREDGVLRHPVLDRPIDGKMVPVFDDDTKAQIPDLTWTLQNWARRDDVLFLELVWSGTVADVPVELAGIDRIALRGDRIAEEIVFVDTYPLRRALDPSLPDTTPIAADDLLAWR